MRENLIIMLLTVIHGILQKIMLKFFFLFNLIIQNNNFYAGVPRPPVPLLYSYHQQVTLANNKRLPKFKTQHFTEKIPKMQARKAGLLLAAFWIEFISWLSVSSRRDFYEVTNYNVMLNIMLAYVIWP